MRCKVLADFKTLFFLFELFFMLLKSFSDAVLSQQSSLKNFLKIFLSLIFDQSRPNSSRLVKKHVKIFCKKFLGLGCCGKTASENDFSKKFQKKLYRAGFDFVSPSINAMMAA